MVGFLRFMGWLAGQSAFFCRGVVAMLPNPLRLLGWKAYERQLLTFRLPAGGLALANDLAIVDVVLKSSRMEFPKSAYLAAVLRPLIGNGVFGQAGGVAVKAKRKAYFLALANVPDQEIDRVSRELSRVYVQRWIASESGTPLPRELSRLTIDIVTETLFGARFTEADSIEFAHAFFAFNQRASPFLLLCTRGDDASVQHLVENMELRSIGNRLRGMIRVRFIDPWLSRDGVTLECDRPGFPYFYRLVIEDACSQPGAMVSGAELAERLLDEVAVMVLAGHETTASALGWLFWEVAARGPGDEGNLPGREGLSAEHIDSLINEALRLYPPIAFYLRDVAEDTEFREKKLAAGSSIAISPWTIHRHRGFWDDAERFCPARWLSKDKEKQGCGDAHSRKNVFIPFGGGSRVCPGRHFAEIEMRAIVGEILRSASFSRLPGPDPRPLGMLTTRPDFDFELAFKRI